jgi:hypothetical protein
LPRDWESLAKKKELSARLEWLEASRKRLAIEISVETAKFKCSHHELKTLQEIEKILSNYTPDLSIEKILLFVESVRGVLKKWAKLISMAEKYS